MTRLGLTEVKTGGVESWTKTVNVAVDVFPKESVASVAICCAQTGLDAGGGRSVRSFAINWRPSAAP